MEKLVVLISIIITYSYCLNFKLEDKNEFCLRFQGGSVYTLQYVVSGNQNQNVICTISQDDRIIFTRQNVSQFQYTNDYQSASINLIYQKIDPIKVCFASTDQQQKQISFDFYQMNDPIKKMIDKKDVSLVQGVLAEAYKQMESISRNQQYQIERDQKHKINLQDSQSKIKWAGIIKIVFLLGSALIQLWIMKGFFTNNNPYQPVETA